MCGIVGCNGEDKASKILLEQLEKLEYRGYDSAGIATIYNGKFEVAKTKGKVKSLLEKTNYGENINGKVGIGHTRWATHGAPTDTNAHPHVSENNKFTIVHNGIIENYLEIKKDLIEKGFSFVSQTDTEIIANLLEYLYNGNVIETIFKATKILKGSYALGILCVDFPQSIFLIKEKSPLIIGFGENINCFASDITALLKYTNNVHYMQNGEIAVLNKDSVKLFDSQNKIIQPKIQKINLNDKSAEKCGYSHFMLKEMFEEPSVIQSTVSSRIIDNEIVLNGFDLSDEEIKNINKIEIIACGSAYHAGLSGKTVIESLCRIPVEVCLASEFRYQNPIIDNKTLSIVISQSGETADTIAGLEECKRLNSKVLSIVNVVESTIARLSDFVLYTYAGPEIAVATTKGYTTQLAVLYLFATYFAKKRNTINLGTYNSLISDLLSLSNKVESAVNNYKEYEKLAQKYYNTDCIFFIGRNTDYYVALEGALKLKEISYIHAEAYPAGELKHGTIALIEENSTVIALCVNNRLIDKMINNIAEVKSRGANVISLYQKGENLIKEVSNESIVIEKVPELFSAIVEIIPLQFLAFYIARQRGCDIDKPKNLAKSVTVE